VVDEEKLAQVPQALDGIENCNEILIFVDVLCSRVILAGCFLQLVERGPNGRSVGSRCPQIYVIRLVFDCLQIVEDVAGFRHQVANNWIIQDEGLRDVKDVYVSGVCMLGLHIFGCTDDWLEAMN
jgi:hypothetical protein